MLQTGSLSHARRFERSILTGMFTNIVFSHQNQAIFQNTEQNEHDLKEGDRNMNNTQARSSADAPKSKPLDRSKTLNSARCAERKEVEHAIFSADPVIEGFETREDWISHREIVVQGLNPVGALESIHAERAALYLWRLKRVTRYETTATQFDHAEVMAEFIVSLDHPEFPRDRSEAVTIEKIRKPLRDYLNDFQSMGAQAAKLPEHQEGLERVRKEAKRVRQRRLLPDQPTIQTIIKYEAHLDRCLTRTMAELRRLQKERRQGLRAVDDAQSFATQSFTERHVNDGATGDFADFKEKDSAPEPSELSEGASDDRSGACQNEGRQAETGCDSDSSCQKTDKDKNSESVREDESPADKSSSKPIESFTPIDPHASIESLTPIGSLTPFDPLDRSHFVIKESEQLDRAISTIVPHAKSVLNGYRISESTPKGIVVHDANSSGVVITKIPQPTCT